MCPFLGVHLRSELGSNLAAQLDGPSFLTLKPDGTGFLKIAPLYPEQPVVWIHEDDKIILRSRFGSEPVHTQSLSDSSNSTKSEGFRVLVATLAADRTAMTLDAGMVQCALIRQP